MWEGRLEFSLHALDEMDEDGLTEADVVDVILKGRLGGRFDGDPRGVRFVVRGRPPDSEDVIEVVCRFLSSGYRPED